MLEEDPKHREEFIPSEEDKRVRINACATMWHENSEEIQVECSTLIGPDPSRYCTLIGWDHDVADASSLIPQ